VPGIYFLEILPFLCLYLLRALSLCQLCLKLLQTETFILKLDFYLQHMLFLFLHVCFWLMLFPIVSCSMAAFRDKSINKWQRMTQVTTGAAAIKGKLHAFNQVTFCDWTQNSTIRCTNYFSSNFLYCCRILAIKLLLIWEIPAEWSSRCNWEDQPLRY
jgi:hypothetical protein